MNENENPTGTTTVAPEVLVTIAQLNALSIPGVSRLYPLTKSVDQIFKRGISAEGVRILVENNTVYADIFVVLENDIIVRDICRMIQNQVSRAISEMVGMEVGRVNVHVEDIDFRKETSSKPE